MPARLLCDHGNFLVVGVANSGSKPGHGVSRAPYDLREIKHWLRVFLHRFFQLSQFKRSALPHGSKISSGGSLSSRGD
jgi:NAD+ synthase (glutamine-hydrolysing)